MALASGWAALFAWLAVQRHLAGGSHAEDLGFTDQVLANFLRGQWFRMSIYQGATWNTEIDIARLARPDSLLAFHFEPMLLVLVPLYAIGGGVACLLVFQAAAMAAGAIPAYRLGHSATGTPVAGVAVAAAYLLSPFGQWAVLADFHTSSLAAPLLLLAAERVVRRSQGPALIAAGLAVLAREDVAPVVAALGVVVAARTRDSRNTGLALLALGLGWTFLGALVIRLYSGGAVSPFDVRYATTLGAGPGASLGALTRPAVLEYVGAFALSGGWLGLLDPLALLPALPSLALNTLSTSPWMAAGKAHYSGLVLPFIAVGAAAGLQRLRDRPGLIRLASAALVLTSLLGYLREGSGPLGGNYAPASVTGHAQRAMTLAENLPPDAAISASSTLVPHVSQRARVYVFPTVLDSDYVLLDLQASPAPTSAGDVFLRVQALLDEGGWRVELAEDGLLLLQRAAGATPIDVRTLSNVLVAEATESQDPLGRYFDGRISLLSAELVPSPNAALDVDGPRWILRTVWRAEQALPPGTGPEFRIDLRDGQQLQIWDTAARWWNPPERWTPGRAVVIDVPEVPVRRFVAWQAVWRSR